MRGHDLRVVVLDRGNGFDEGSSTFRDAPNEDDVHFFVFEFLSDLGKVILPHLVRLCEKDLFIRAPESEAHTFLAFAPEGIILVEHAVVLGFELVDNVFGKNAPLVDIGGECGEHVGVDGRCPDARTGARVDPGKQFDRDVVFHGETVRGAVTSEQREHVFAVDQFLDDTRRPFWIIAVVLHEERELASMDAALIVDIREIGVHGFGDRREIRSRSCQRRPGPDLDLFARDADIGASAACGDEQRENRCQRENPFEFHGSYSSCSGRSGCSRLGYSRFGFRANALARGTNATTNRNPATAPPGNTML